MNKENLINLLQNQELTEEQILEISQVIKGELSERTIINKLQDILSKIVLNFEKILKPSWVMIAYRLAILLIFAGLIVFLSSKNIIKGNEVSVILGAFIGFVFGQKSSIFRF
ncbi:MAG: hypothetical protein K8R54_17050 [Bacteroidales bacterium]|nr:hypothetical protein [Bacteroidales bacterium]